MVCEKAKAMAKKSTKGRGVKPLSRGKIGKPAIVTIKKSIPSTSASYCSDCGAHHHHSTMCAVDGCGAHWCGDCAPKNMNADGTVCGIHKPCVGCGQKTGALIACCECAATYCTKCVRDDTFVTDGDGSHFCNDFSAAEPKCTTNLQHCALEGCDVWWHGESVNYEHCHRGGALSVNGVTGMCDSDVYCSTHCGEEGARGDVDAGPNVTPLFVGDGEMACTRCSRKEHLEECKESGIERWRDGFAYNCAMCDAIEAYHKKHGDDSTKITIDTHYHCATTDTCHGCDDADCPIMHENDISASLECECDDCLNAVDFSTDDSDDDDNEAPGVMTGNHIGDFIPEQCRITVQQMPRTIFTPSSKA